MTDSYLLLSVFFGGVAVTALVAYFVRRRDLKNLATARATRDAAIEKWNTVSGELFEARLERDTAIEGRNSATAAQDTAIEERNVVIEELERTAWSLGGRLRSTTDPPIYLMPPGQKKVTSCDEARLAWMDNSDKASKALRAAGLGLVADKIHPENYPAFQPGISEQ